MARHPRPSGYQPALIRHRARRPASLSGMLAAAAPYLLVGFFLFAAWWISDFRPHS